MTCPAACRRRDRGTALVTALVLIFSFTSVGVVLLARGYDERVTTRSVAQSIAFQAARSGAQQVSVVGLRDGGTVSIDGERAYAAAVATGRSLLADANEVGTVSVSVDGDRVTVVVEIDDVVEGGFADSRRAVVRAEGSARAVGT